MTSKSAEYARRYRERHPERIRASILKWREKHPEKVLEARKKYRERNRVMINARHNKWRRENPQKRKESNDRYWAKNPGKRLSYHLVRYGITVEEFNRFLQNQKERCAACRNGVSGKQRRLHVDHNHTTGKVRGLLCGPCNRAIGFAEENPARLRALADYLESNS